MGLILRNVLLHGRRPADVRTEHGRIAQICAAHGVRPRPGDTVVDGRGTSLLPGLHDRHLHLAALAADLGSLACGPPAVRTRGDLAERVRRARPRSDGWIRATGYHESVAGVLTRTDLDTWQPQMPVRIQHRSGALWMLNSAACAQIGLSTEPDTAGGHLPEGVERDDNGIPNGRLWRLDTWMRDRLGLGGPPDLAPVGRLLASYGITAVTDATPELTPDTIRLLTDAVHIGALPQQVTVLGAHPRDLHGRAAVALRTGPHKLLPPDHDPWPYDEFVARVQDARGRTGRPVAVHAVTREGLLLTLAALAAAGPVPGDRIEHAAIVPREARSTMRDLGLRVVTQPGFVVRRGDHYLRDCHRDDIPLLYPYASLVAAGVPVYPSSDAPYGPVDPWATMRAAAGRRTVEGTILGAHERVPVATALRAMTALHQIRVGGRADVCLLHGDLAAIHADPQAARVRMTLSRGEVVFDAEVSPGPAP